MNLTILLTVLNIAFSTVNWDNNICNPDNEEYVQEIAFNLSIEQDAVTQEQFNERYINPKTK